MGYVCKRERKECGKDEDEDLGERVNVWMEVGHRGGGVVSSRRICCASRIIIVVGGLVHLFVRKLQLQEREREGLHVNRIYIYACVCVRARLGTGTQKVSVLPPLVFEKVSTFFGFSAPSFGPPNDFLLEHLPHRPSLLAHVTTAIPYPSQVNVVIHRSS